MGNNFQRPFRSCRQKLKNHQKLFVPIFDGYAQAAKNIINLILAKKNLTAENYSVPGVLHTPISILHRF
jgi:hypothetical protein